MSMTAEEVRKAIDQMIYNRRLLARSGDEFNDTGSSMAMMIFLAERELARMETEERRIQEFKP